MIKPSFVGWKGALFMIHAWFTATKKRALWVYYLGCFVTWFMLRTLAWSMDERFHLQEWCHTHLSLIGYIAVGLAYWLWWFGLFLIFVSQVWHRWILAYGAYNHPGKPL